MFFETHLLLFLSDRELRHLNSFQIAGFIFLSERQYLMLIADYFFCYVFIRGRRDI